MPGPAGSAADLYRPLDDAKLSRFHWLTVITAGMGFFTDAYDLFIIGTVTAILTPIWHLSTTQISLLNSVSLLAAVAGALVFGRLMDHLGRKATYGLEVAILALGALLSAFAWSFGALFAFRILVGFGVGGDYATSAVLTSEYANRANRGRLIGTVFSMQGLGLLAGPAVAGILLASGVSHALAWRIMLGLGAIPAVSVIYLRRRIRETPRYSLAVRGDLATTASTVAWATTYDPAVAPATNGATGSHAAPTNGATGSHAAPTNGSQPPGQPGSRRASLLRRPYLLRLIGTAGSWFLLDIAFYGNSVSSPLILKALQPHATLLDNILIAGAIFLVAALPGYWVAVYYLDRIGRRRIQWQGFLVMALAFGALALIPGVSGKVVLFLVLFGISYFFIEFGPNMTTFVFPAEIFPTKIRGIGDGLSAGSGKFGAFLGALFVPTLLKTIHLDGVMGIMAGVSLVGVLLTLAALPEPKGKTLEDSCAEVIALPAPQPVGAGEAASV